MSTLTKADLLQAAEMLLNYANELFASETIDGQWPDPEVKALYEDEMRMALRLRTAAERPADDLDALDALIAGAEPGPWILATSNSTRRISRPSGVDGGVLDAHKHPLRSYPTLGATMGTLEYIAGMNPVVARGLIDELRECRRQVEALRVNNVVPGVMHCAKCKFQLVRTNLYLGSGTAGPGDNKTEPCPNGCGPLWPVTWEQYATDGWNVAEKQHAEIEALKKSLERVYPSEMTPALRKILGLVPWITGPTAHRLNGLGWKIKPKMEEEQAEVLHWMIGLALEHGEDWYKVANEILGMNKPKDPADSATQAGGADGQA